MQNSKLLLKIKKTFHFSLRPEFTQRVHSEELRAKALFTFNFWRSQKGFTLIELLIVIAIITLVTALLFPNFMGVRQRARDAQRKSDLSQIQKALELYKLDQNPPAYPVDATLASCNLCWSTGTECTENIYMRKIPCDPSTSDSTPYIYKRNPTDELKYTLIACLENPVDSDRDVPADGTSCAKTGTSYTINEP